jgi:hypothetical protein
LRKLLHWPNHNHNYPKTDYNGQALVLALVLALVSVLVSVLEVTAYMGSNTRCCKLSRRSTRKLLHWPNHNCNGLKTDCNRQVMESVLELDLV